MSDDHRLLLALAAGILLAVGSIAARALGPRAALRIVGLGAAAVVGGLVLDGVRDVSAPLQVRPDLTVSVVLFLVPAVAVWALARPELAVAADDVGILSAATALAVHLELIPAIAVAVVGVVTAGLVRRVADVPSVRVVVVVVFQLLLVALVVRTSAPITEPWWSDATEPWPSIPLVLAGAAATWIVVQVASATRVLLDVAAGRDTLVRHLDTRSAPWGALVAAVLLPLVGGRLAVDLERIDTARALAVLVLVVPLVMAATRWWLDRTE